MEYRKPNEVRQNMLFNLNFYRFMETKEVEINLNDYFDFPLRGQSIYVCGL